MIKVLIIVAIFIGVAGFVTGVLFGRKNASKVEKTIDVAKVVANNVEKTVEDIKTTTEK